MADIDLSGVPRFPVVCIDETDTFNTDPATALDFPLNTAYLVIGQPTVIDPDTGEPDDINHYILLDISKGEILRGMYHADRFRFVNHDDPFF
jgi:hypothetical protein